MDKIGKITTIKKNDGLCLKYLTCPRFMILNSIILDKLYRILAIRNLQRYLAISLDMLLIELVTTIYIDAREKLHYLKYYSGQESPTIQYHFDIDSVYL